MGWLAADLHLNGAPLQQAPRNVLKRAIVAAAEEGFAMRSGVECEFFLIAPDGQSISDPEDAQDKPCYDQQALMRRFDVIAEICDSLGELKWGVYQNDHEDANGQFEINWSFDDALKTADRHLFFKYMVKSIAEKHGVRATFMPKPFSNLTGNGCHAHVSLWSTTAPETNLFADPAGELGLSPVAYHFIGGLTHSGAAICALTNPTVNSYKRLNAPVTYGRDLVPEYDHILGEQSQSYDQNSGQWPSEFRLADGAANPYLLQAAILAAGMDGIRKKRDPGKRIDVNMYTQGAEVGDVQRLPPNLLDAIRCFEKSEILAEAFGEEFITGYGRSSMASGVGLRSISAHGSVRTRWTADRRGSARGRWRG